MRCEMSTNTKDNLAMALKIIGSIAMVVIAGCTVGPNYKRPNYTAPPVYRGADEAAVSSAAKTSIADEQWAKIYQEPELQDLIRRALTNNYDLRIAAQHILEQEAQVRITRSQQFPTVTIGGLGLGASLPTSALGTSAIPSPLVDGSLSVSGSWTPDFWGQYRRQTEGARPPCWPKPGRNAQFA